MSSSGPENRFIQAIHRLLPADVYRMKNHNPYTAGIPDCWYSGSVGDLWVEYKFVSPPKRASTIVDLCAGDNPKLSALQQSWLIGRHKEGRSVGVVVGTPMGGLWLPGISWAHPLSSAEYSSLILPKAELARIIANIVSNPGKKKVSKS